MNYLEATPADASAEVRKSERIALFASKNMAEALKIGGHTWSHKPFDISEVRFRFGDV